MEVHSHSHTPRKKWTHYLWEFLMLFLAVFCGFLAEYQLEHIIEHQRGKEYAHTLYEDLKADTALLNNEIRERNIVIPKIDSFRLLVHNKIFPIVEHKKRGLYTIRQSLPAPVFHYENCTCQVSEGSYKS